jgi:CMP-N,N'-diacetyllegionaminic acid synthase
MYKGNTFLAIIPARSGSKRLPGKNSLNLNGKPLVKWSIDAGLKSNYIDEIVVTSDDFNIVNISKKAGVKVVKRSSELATDTATTIDVVANVIENFPNYDYIVLLQPTSPLRTEVHIDEAIELLDIKSADAIVSVCKAEHSPLWSNTLNESLSMKGFLRDYVHNQRSQDLESYYRLNGAIYICNTKTLLRENRILIEDNIYAYKMDRGASIDIDEKIDFLMCEKLMEDDTNE